MRLFILILFICAGLQTDALAQTKARSERLAGQARLMMERGKEARARKQPQQAVQAYTAAARLFSRSGDIRSQAEALTALVEIEREAGRHAPARAFAERALALREKLGDKELIFTSLFTLASLSNEQNEYARAIDFYERARTVAGAEKIKLARADSAMAGVYSRSGDYKKAIALFQQTLTIYQELGDGINIGIALNRIGSAYTNMGDYIQARKYYEQALAQFETIKNTGWIGGVLQNLGAVAYYQGDFLRAVSFALRAVKILDAQGDEPKMLAALNNLSLYYLNQGDYKEAFNYFQQAEKLALKINDRRALATSYARLGAIYKAQHKYEQAIATFQQTLKQPEVVSNIAETAVLSNDVTRCLIAIKDYAGALEWSNRALEKARASSERLTIAEVLSTRAEVLRASGDRKAALATINEALVFAKELNAPAVYWPAYYLQGQVVRDEGDRAAAIESFKLAVGWLQNLRNRLAGGAESEKYFLVDERQKVYVDLVDLLIAAGRHAEAFEYVEQAKQRELTQLYRRSGSRPADEAEAAAYQRLQSLFTRQNALEQQLLHASERVRREQLQIQLTELQKEQEGFARELAERYPRVAEIVGLKPISFASIQRAVPAQALVIEFFPLKDRIAIFAFDSGSLSVRTAAVAPEELNAQIEMLRATVSRSGSGYKGPMKELSRKLWDLLIAPCQAEMAKAEHLLISTSGKLRYLPFQALWNGEQYLIERVPVSYLSTASSLIFYRDAAASTTRNRALAMGNPLNRAEEIQLSPLPEAEAEARDFGKIFGARAVIRTGGEVTKANLRTDAPAAELIHLATHAILDAKQPERSFILMSGESVEARRLTYGEIPLLEPHLRGANLVTLSACETALDVESQGLEISGLSEQFRQAGVKSVVASLWKVNDRSTRMLMAEFYTQLSSGQSKSAALRAAQLSLLRSGSVVYADPFFWAPFILIGDYR